MRIIIFRLGSIDQRGARLIDENYIPKLFAFWSGLDYVISCAQRGINRFIEKPLFNSMICINKLL